MCFRYIPFYIGPFKSDVGHAHARGIFKTLSKTIILITFVKIPRYREHVSFWWFCVLLRKLFYQYQEDSTFLCAHPSCAPVAAPDSLRRVSFCSFDKTPRLYSCSHWDNLILLESEHCITLYQMSKTVSWWTLDTHFSLVYTLKACTSHTDQNDSNFRTWGSLCL